MKQESDSQQKIAGVCMFGRLARAAGAWQHLIGELHDQLLKGGTRVDRHPEELQLELASEAGILLRQQLVHGRTCECATISAI